MQSPNIQQLLADIHALTGFGVTLYDDQYRGLFHFQRHMSFCAFLHTNPATTERCRLFDNECFHSAEAAGEVVVHTCPFGIFTAIAPIYDSDTLLGYLQFDGVLSDTKQAEQAHLQSALAYLPDQEHRLREKSRDVPRKSERELEAARTILHTVCRYIEAHSLFPFGQISLGLLAKRYIKHNLQCKLTLADIAANLHCSKATLTETFRREFGITIVQYINKNRLEKACHLLVSTELPIGIICEECGFSGGEYFSTLFKKAYALSPLAYRKRQSGTSA